MPDSLQDTGIVVNPDGSVATLYPRIYDLLVAPVQIVNDNTERTLWQPKTVKASDFQLPGIHFLEMQLDGDYLHNNVAADTITFRVYLGAAKVLDAAFAFNAIIGANAEPWYGRLRVRLQSSQWTALKIEGKRPDTVAPTLGQGGQSLGGGGDGSLNPLHVTRQTALNLSVDTAIRLSVQWSAASLNNSFRLGLGSLILY